MTAQVIHHPRVAWDAARTFVAFAAADRDSFNWFGLGVTELLGVECRTALQDTRVRLGDPSPDVSLRELARWRVRLEDLLGQRPEVAEALRILITPPGR